MNEALKNLEVVEPAHASELLADGQVEALVVPEPRYKVLRFVGRDVLALLHTKLTIDTKTLAVGEARWGHATDINGRIIVSASFYRSAEQEVLAVGPMSDPSAVAAHFEKYVIMEDVEVSDLSEACTVLRLGRAGVDALRAHGLLGSEGDSVRLVVEPRAASPALASLAIVASERLADVGEALKAPLQLVSAETWQDFEVAVGFAAPVRDLLVDETIPLQFSQEVGVVFGKGCYLGQEVIERMYSRGSANRRLMRLRGEGSPPAAGTRLKASKRDAVWVTSTVAAASGWVGLGYVGRAHLEKEELALSDEAGEQWVVRLSEIDEARFGDEP
jgi:folate-binding protein YgfZ